MLNWTCSVVLSIQEKPVMSPVISLLFGLMNESMPVAVVKLFGSIGVLKWNVTAETDP